MDRHDARTTPADPAASLRALELEVREARATAEADPQVEARRLARVERELLRVGEHLRATNPDLAGEGERAALADLARWRSRLDRLGLDEARQRADAALQRFVREAAADWRAHAREAAGRGEADACFRCLARATEIDREALLRQVGRTTPPLQEDRGPLREAFRLAVEAHPPSEAQRDRWATDLLDRADVVLTAVDDLDPDDASQELGLVADDLDVHLRIVERTRGPRRIRLRRKLRRLRAESQERLLQEKLEALFGRRAVGRWERLIIGLILLVLALLFVEAVFPLPPEVIYWMTVADTLACFVFLWDFFFRLWLVGDGRGPWFLRHVLVDFVPSIPFGVLTLHAHGSDAIRVGRAVRLLRLTRVARYVRVLMPVIRLVRAFGFLTRGLDRLVRRYGHLLNRDIILYPTRAERAAARRREVGPSRRLLDLEAEVGDLWNDLLVSAPAESRDPVARIRVDALAEAHAAVGARCLGLEPAAPSSARQIPAETLVRRLDATTPEGVEAEHGHDFTARLARALRTFSRPPLRWIPILRRYVPVLGAGMSDSEVVTAGAQHLAGRLRRYLDRWFFFADLYGTVTPAEFVDRVGATLVKGAFRPAYRLTLFGTGALLVEGLISITPSEFLQGVAELLGRFVATPLVVLGAACVIVLSVGWWLQRVAGEATAFLEQTAAAQFLPLMESIKGRFLARDADVLVERVLEPESVATPTPPGEAAGTARRRFVESVQAWLLEAQTRGDATGSFDAMERAVLLYRDGMDGALFDASDTRTTNQLLGNPALRTLRRTAWCITPQERRALRNLDLTQQRRVFSGPLLWFSLVTRAVTHAAARLIVEYNRYAIPLEEIETASPEERSRRAAWLGRPEAEVLEEAARHAATEHVTTAFTALHFLDDDPRRDQEVRERFGEDVLARLRRDRRALFRRIFGTYPLHTRPHEQRVVNLYRLYETYLAGGRALLIPWRGLWASVRWLGRVVAWVVRAVREIRSPRLRTMQQEEAEADFATAVRKIDRMRGPVVRAALWLRARVDVEYLGVHLPGTRSSGLEGRDVQRDLEFLDAAADLRRRVEEERDLAQSDVRRVAVLLDGGLRERVAHHLGVPTTALGREHLRALVFAWRADLHGVRSLLAADEILEESLLEAADRPLLPGRFPPPVRLAWVFRRWWRANGRGGRAGRRAAWRALLHDQNGVRRALTIWERGDGARARAEGERRLAELLRHPARLTEQLVTLRTVQVLALIDVLNYRTHIWRLGQYAADGDDPGGLLTLDH